MRVPEGRTVTACWDLETQESCPWFGSESGIDGTDDLAGGTNTADLSQIGEHNGHRAGASLDSAGDTNGDGFPDLIVGAPFYKPDNIYYGAVYVAEGPLSAGLYQPLSGGSRIKGDDGSYLGQAAAGVGDVNFDGHDDILLGGPGYRADAGAAWLVLGSSRGIDRAETITEIAVAKRHGLADNDAAGSSLSGAGDIDSDGFHDVLVGAPLFDTTSSNGTNSDGAAALFYGPITGDHSLADAGALFQGSVTEYAGRSVTGGGDLDNDGAPDIAIGAAEMSTTTDGRVYVWYGANW